MWNGQSWKLFDTVSYKMDATIQQIAVTKTGNVFFPGYFRNDKGEYCVVKWNGTGWEKLSTKGTVGANMESVSLGQGDTLFAAGWMQEKYEYVIAKWTDNIGWETFASSKSYFTAITVTANCVYATVKSGRRVFCFTRGSNVNEAETNIQKPAATTQPSQPIIKAEERKDTKANEVWQIFESYRTTYKEKYKIFVQSTDQVFVKDDNGRFTNQVVWKSLSYRIKTEIPPLKEYVEDYRKQLTRLSLKEKENELYDVFFSYLNYSIGYLNTVDYLMDELKYVIITEEMKNAVENAVEMSGEVTRRVNKLNPVLTPYKRRNGIF